jgi:hypothetical protein
LPYQGVPEILRSKPHGRRISVDSASKMRYAHAKRLKKLRTYLGRIIRDIARKIEGDGGLEAAFAQLLLLARRVRE